MSAMLEARKMEHQESRKPHGAYRASLREEAERLIKLAEELHSKCEDTKKDLLQHENKVFGAGLLIFLIVPFFVRSALSPMLTLPLISLGARLHRTLGMKELKSRIRSNERALLDVVALLREAQSRLAESEGWSTLEEAEFHIRFSRFESVPA